MNAIHILCRVMLIIGSLSMLAVQLTCSSSGCTLNCDAISGHRVALKSSCEAQPLVEREVGPGWNRFTIDTTDGKTGRKYHIWGNIVNDPLSGKTKYYMSATGGLFGEGTRTCKSDDVIGPAPADPVRSEASRTVPQTVTVPVGFLSSIPAPACEKARAEGRITGDTYVCMASSKGDWIGQGETWIHAQPRSSFTAEYYAQGESAVKVTVSEAGESWDLEFGLADGKTWAPGLYGDASKYRPFQDRPGLSVSGHGRGCSEGNGRFEILELAHEGSSVKRLAVNFEQFCDGKGPLSGMVRFNSTITR